MYMTETQRFHKAELLTTKRLATTLDEKQAYNPQNNFGDEFKLKINQKRSNYLLMPISADC
jgi:hypothetical protein